MTARLSFCSVTRGQGTKGQRVPRFLGPFAPKAWALCAGFAIFLIALQSPAASVIGTRLDNFQLLDSSGKAYSLDDYKGKIVILAFWSFKCPVSVGYDRRLAELAKQYGPKGVVILGIDSNSDESAEAIQKNAAALDLAYPILLDPDGVLADRIGATHTPTIFILDRDFVVRYAGMVDNGKKPGEKGRESYAAQALDSILSDRKVAVEETKGRGCSIKRRSF